MLTELAAALAPHGLIIRGGFHPAGEEGVLRNAATVLLVGNAGQAMWEAFAQHIDAERNPLDRWTRRVVAPIAAAFSARAVYPFGPDPAPFQQWARRAETVYPSPLGILIHPQFGLWHAYRAALLFAQNVDLPLRSDASNPCESCLGKPCLSACPVGAFNGKAYDLSACAGHISKPSSDCSLTGCHARHACPVGREWRYPTEQVGFHMAAFTRSVVGRRRLPAPDLV